MNIAKVAAVFTAAVSIAGWASVSYTGSTGKREDSMTDYQHQADKQGLKEATFAGGCFWCMESDFEKVEGVQAVVSGYTGGDTPDPAYEEVSTGTTGHAEAVRVIYDPGKVSYSDLLAVFWDHIDPTDPSGQFADRGSQYRSEIFYHDREQKRLAEASKKALESSGFFEGPIATRISKVQPFYEAEAYHQDYYKKNSVGYRLYRKGSGRDRFLEERRRNGTLYRTLAGTQSREKKWTKPDDNAIRKMLSDRQYRVTQADATEPPFDNAYWDNKAAGIYVDVVSGEPLFSSLDKFDSGTGWPSFSKPLVPTHVVEKEDTSLFMKRTEVRSRYGDSHLGHVFQDGPAPTGLRYCINSAALRFIPEADLEKEGYGAYLDLFTK